MRATAALMALTISLPVAAFAAQPGDNARSPEASAESKCPRTTSYLADKSGLYRGEPLRPRKLTELPPATTYMAVYRRIGLCEAPLTMAEYRNSGRR
jgi:hypothetical protein